MWAILLDICIVGWCVLTSRSGLHSWVLILTWGRCMVEGMNLGSFGWGSKQVLLMD